VKYPKNEQNQLKNMMQRAINPYRL